jgi:plastocyanin
VSSPRVLLVATLVAGLLAGGAVGAGAGAGTARARAGVRPHATPKRHARSCRRRRRHRRCPRSAQGRRKSVAHTPATTTTPSTTPATTVTSTAPPPGTTTAVATTTTGPTTTAPAPLPSRLEVDENDLGSQPRPYSLYPTHNPVAAGTVEFNVYNFGQDPHTFAIEDSKHHQLAFADVPANQPQTAVQVSATLAPGHYTLLCTLTGHAALGMQATLLVK